MSERRFFVQQIPTVGAELQLDASTARHLYVLRIKPNAILELFDASGRQAQAELLSLRETDARCRVLSELAKTHEISRLVLVQCLPKGSKLELGVRMATELGVSAIHLAISERTVSRPVQSRHDSRHERLLRIVQEASEQAQRHTLAEIVPAAPLIEAAARAPSHARKVVFWECSNLSLDGAFQWDDTQEAWVVVGPEGGLSKDEIQALKTLGYMPHALGDTVLRVETAVPVALALIADRLGMWGNGPRGALLKRHREPC